MPFDEMLFEVADVRVCLVAKHASHRLGRRVRHKVILYVAALRELPPAPVYVTGILDAKFILLVVVNSDH